MTSTWGRTPSFGAQTPMVGSMTPSYSMTPMHGAGGRTPMYGSQTPMHDGTLPICTTETLILFMVVVISAMMS